MKIYSVPFVYYGIALILAISEPLQAGDCCDLSSPFSCSTPVACGTGCSVSCSDTCASCRAITIGRSTHNNSAFFGLAPYLYQPDECECNGGVMMGYEFLNTFDSCKLARAIAGTRTLQFQGSQVPNRSSNALIADYFGLSQTFNGAINLDPAIQNSSLHMQFYFGWDGLIHGFYTTFDLTFTSQKRRLVKNQCALAYNAQTIGTSTPFPPAYMGTDTVTPASSFFDALSGTMLFGDMTTPWSAGRWTPYTMSDQKLAGVSVNVGYNPILCDEYHLGLFVRYTAPTGTRLDGGQKFFTHFFAPIIGNGHHHELGAGLHAHTTFWIQDDTDSLTLFLDGYATHLFSDTQWRSFDFKGRGCFSRYMLLKELKPATTDTDQFDPMNKRVYDYVGEKGLVNGINFATRAAESSFSVQGDAALRLIYQHKSLEVTLGYNIFGRSAEKLCLKKYSPCNGLNDSKFYGFKGCQGVYAYVYALDGTNQTMGTGTATPLNATASTATIRTCGTVDAGTQLLLPTVAAGIAWNNVYSTSAQPANAVLPNTQVPSQVALASESQPAQALTADDLDVLSGAMPSMVTNKGFLTIDYTFDTFCTTPFIGVGFEIEGGSCGSDIGQYGFWVRGGASW